MKHFIFTHYKSKWVTNVLYLVIVIALAFTLLYRMGYWRNKKNIVAVYELSGIIMESVSSATYITPDYVEDKMGEASKYGAVVLRINSPGGSVVASQEILSIIRNFKEVYPEIPVIISMGEMAASGGYYIALGGDKIIANGGTITGSIGVISEFMYVQGLYDKLGIETERVTSGKYKGIGGEPLSQEERQIMQTLSDNIYEQFVKEVAQSREMEIETVKELATGEVFSGEQAKALGLVDDVGTLHDAVVMASEMGNLPAEMEIKDSGEGIFSDLFGTMSEIRMFFHNLNTGIRGQQGIKAQWIIR